MDATDTDVFYKKVDGEYQAVAWYNQGLEDALPLDSAVLFVHKTNCIVRRDHVDIALAPLLAGGEFLREAMVNAMSKIDVPKPPTTSLTEQEAKAWNHLISIGGDGFKSIGKASSGDIVDAAVVTLIEKMQHILSDPTVADAYSQFKMCVKLKLEQSNIV